MSVLPNISVIPHPARGHLAGLFDCFLDQWDVEEALLIRGTGDRVNDLPRLRLVTQGCARVQIVTGGDVLNRDFTPQQPLFAAPGACARPKWHGSATMACVVLGPDQTRVAAVEHSVLPEGHATDRLRHHTGPALGMAGQSIVDALCELSRDDAPPSVGAHLLRALLGIVRREAFAQPPPIGGKGQQTFLAIRDYVREHCCDQVSRARVAAVFSITPTHLSRLFRQQGDESFSQFLTRSRLQHASDLLATTHLTVNEIAYQCGYNDPSYFIRVYRRKHGGSPGRMRASRRAP